MKFSRLEIKEISKAWFAISLAFAIALGGFKQGITGFSAVFAISLFTVGLGFVFHELSHKYLAQKYRCWAEFRANNAMLIFAVLISFTGFIFAAPGGVFIKGRISRKRYGMIAAAGPFMNIILGIVFLALALFLLPEMLASIAYMGARINAWLALFNMIPIMGLDGRKILAASKPIYIVEIIAAGALMLVTSL